jgi:hypothetical protein
MKTCIFCLSSKPQTNTSTSRTWNGNFQIDVKDTTLSFSFPEVLSWL